MCNENTGVWKEWSIFWPEVPYQEGEGGKYFFKEEEISSYDIRKSVIIISWVSKTNLGKIAKYPNKIQIQVRSQTGNVR